MNKDVSDPVKARKQALKDKLKAMRRAAYEKAKNSPKAIEMREKMRTKMKQLRRAQYEKMRDKVRAQKKGVAEAERHVSDAAQTSAAETARRERDAELMASMVKASELPPTKPRLNVIKGGRT